MVRFRSAGKRGPKVHPLRRAFERLAFGRPLRVEQLEQRALLAIDITLGVGTATFDGDIGGAADDDLVLSTDGVNYQHNLVSGGIGGVGIYADDFDFDPTAAVLNIPLGAAYQFQFFGVSGNDTLTLDFANGSPVPANGVDFNGGGDAGDTLIIENGTFTTIETTFTGVTSGSVDLDGEVVTFSAIAPVLINVGTAADVIFNLPVAVQNPDAVLSDDGVVGNNLSQLAGSTFETTVFTNPTNSLTVNLGPNGDTIATQDMDSLLALPGGLWINDGAGNDTVNIETARTTAGASYGIVNVDFTAGGTNVANLSPTAQTLDTVVGAVFVNGGAGPDTISLLDSLQAAGDEYTVTDSLVDSATIPWGGLTYGGAIDVLNLLTGDGDDIVQVLSTLAGASTTASMGNGSGDAVYVGVLGADLDTGVGSLANLAGDLVVVDPIWVYLYVDNTSDTLDRDWTLTSPVALSGQLAIPAYVAGTITYGTLPVDIATIYAGDGDDELTVDFTGGSPLPWSALDFRGGGETLGDSLVLASAVAVNAVTHSFSGEGNGSIDVDTGSPMYRTIDYSGLEPITDNLNAADRVFTFANVVGDGTLTDAGGGLTRIDSGQSESVDFTTPTNSLTINLAAGANAFSVDSLAAGYNTPTNYIGGGAGDDVINFEVSDAGANGWWVGGGAGNNTVNLSPTAMLLGNLTGRVTFFAGGNNDTLNIYDNNQATGDTYTITSTTVDRAGWGGATYDAFAEAINLTDTGDGADIIDVNSTSANVNAVTTVVSCEAYDTINVPDITQLGSDLVVDGSLGLGILNIDAQGEAVTITGNVISFSVTAATITFSNVDVDITNSDGGTMTVVGTGGSDNLILQSAGGAAPDGQFSWDGGTTWISFDQAAFSFDGQGDDDTMTVDYANGAPILTGGISFTGGAQTTSDRLTIQNGAFVDVTYNASGVGAGNVVLDDGVTPETITFTGLEPVAILPGPIGTLTINITDGAAHSITLQDDGVPSDGISEVVIDGGLESATFTNPTTLVLNTAVGLLNDTVTLAALDDLGPPTTININTNDGADTVNVLATPVGSTTTVDTAAGAGDAVYVGVISTLVNTGVGTLANLAGNLVSTDSNNMTLFVDNTSDVTDHTWDLASPGAGQGTFTVSGVGGTITFDTLTTQGVRIYAGDGDDLLTVDFTGATLYAPLPSALLAFDAGGQAVGDSMVLTGTPAVGNFTTIVHTFINDNNGVVEFDTVRVINYTGLEPIVDNLSAVDRVFTFSNAVGDGTLTDAGGGLTRIDSAQSESVDFATPTNSLTVNLAAGANVFSVDGLETATPYNTPTNTINCGAGGDTINFEVSDAGAGGWTVNGGAGDDTANLSPTAMDLDNLTGAITFIGGGGVADALNIYDGNQTRNDTFAVTSTTVTRTAPFGGVTYDATLESLNLEGAGAAPFGETYNVTSTSATASTIITDGAGDAVFNITGNALAGNNIFNGGIDQDTFVVSLAAGTTITATSAVINGDDPPATLPGDTVVINDAGPARTTNITYADATATSGDVDVVIDGGTNLDLNTIERLQYNGDAGNDDTVAVQGTTAADVIFVQPTGLNAAGIYLNGNPPTFPGVNGGSFGPDLALAGVAGLNVNGGAPLAPLPADTLVVDLTATPTTSLDIIPSQIGAAGTWDLDPGVLLPFSFWAFETFDVAGGPYGLVVREDLSNDANLVPILGVGGMGFIDGVTPDTIDVRMDATGTDLRIEVGPSAGPLVHQFSGALAQLDGVEAIGSTDDDTLAVTETAGGLPAFGGSAPGSHTNAPFVASGRTPANVGLHFDGGAGTDAIQMALLGAADVAFFSDLVGASNSGVINVDGVMTMSFETLAPIYFNGGGGGTLTVDATGTPLTALTIDDDINAPPPLAVPAFAGDGVTAIWDPVGGNGFETVQYTGFAGVTVLGGTGAQTMTLVAIDHDGVQTSMTLDADNTTGTDASDDFVIVETLPAGVAAALLSGTDGGVLGDTFRLSDSATSALNNILGPVDVSPPADEAGVKELEVWDFADLTGDTILVTSTTIEGITGYAGSPDITYNTGDVIETIDVISSDLALDTFNIQSTMAGSTYDIDTGVFGAFSDVVNVSSDAPANLGTLNAIQGRVNIGFGSGAATALNVSDLGDTVGDNYTLTDTGGGVTQLAFDDGEDIYYNFIGPNSLANFTLVGAAAGAAPPQNTYTINDTTATAANTISDGALGASNGALFTIQADSVQAGAANTFTGFDGDDTFNLNFAADATIPTAAGTTFVINGGPPAATLPGDAVVIDTSLDTLGRAAIGITYASVASGDVDITGLGTDPAAPNNGILDVNEVETLNYIGSAANDDQITVSGTAGNDEFTVTPTAIDAIGVLFNGGVAGGSFGPDLGLAGLAPNGFLVDGLAPVLPTIPGDTLIYDSAGNATLQITGPGDGTLTQAGFIDVFFVSIEEIETTGGGFDIVVDAGAGANDGNPDFFILELDATGTNLQITVDGVLVYNGLLASVNTVTVNGSSDDDTLTVDNANGLVNPNDLTGPSPQGIRFDGEALGVNTGIDSLVIQGDPTLPPGARETYASGPIFGLGPDAGYVIIDPDDSAGPGAGFPTFAGLDGDEQIIAFLNLQPIFDTTPVALFDIFTTPNPDTINVIDGPGIGIFNTTEVNDGGTAAFESVEFANKTTVTVNGLDGADTFTVNNPVPADGMTSMSLYGNELTGGTLNPDDNAADVFRLEAIAVPHSAFGQGGDDVFNVSSDGTGVTGNLDGITALVTLDGGAGSNTVNVSDQSAAVADDATITNAAITGLAAAAINYTASGDFAGGINITGTDVAGGDTLRVQSTLAGGTTTVNAGGGTDTINVSSDGTGFTGNVDGILGQLDVLGGADSNILNVSDQSAVVADDATITNAAIVDLAPVTINYSATGDFGGGIAVTGTDVAGGDTLHVVSTLVGGTTAVNAGAGTDTILVSSDGTGVTGNLDGILGQLDIFGGDDSNALFVSDQSAAVADDGTITNAAITGMAPVAINYSATGDFAGGITIIGTDVAAGDTLRVQSTLAGGLTTVMSLAGADTFNVSSDGTGVTGNLDGILGDLQIGGSVDANTLNVSDQSAAVADDATITNADITGMAPAVIGFFAVGSFAGGINITGTDVAGGDTLRIESTLFGGTTTINAGAGTDTINVSSDGTGVTGNVDDILDQLDILGGADSNTLNVSDQSAAVADDATITNAAITGLAPGTINYSATGDFAGGINVAGTDVAGGDILRIVSTLVGGTTTINAGGGTDAINVSSDGTGVSGNLDAILGQLDVLGGADSNTLNVSDQSAAAADAATITNAAITGMAPVTINYSATGDFGGGINVTATDAAPGDTLNVQSTLAGGTTTVNGGAGDDVFNVSSDAPVNAGTLNNLAGPLVLNGDGGTNTLFLSDAGDLADNIGTLTSTTLTGLGTAGVTYADMAALTLDLGSGNDTLTLESVHAGATTINGNAGADTLIIDNSLATGGLVVGTFTFNGGAGFDEAVIQGDPGLPGTARETYVAGPSIGLTANDGFVLIDPDDSVGPGADYPSWPALAGLSGDEMFFNFTGLSPIVDTTPAPELDIFTTPAADTIRILDGPIVGGFATTLVDDGGTGAFESIAFANKTNVTINGVDGADTFTLSNPSPASGLANLFLYGNELTDGAVNPDDGAGDVFNLQAVSVNTFAYGQGGNDTFNVGAPVGPGFSLDAILGALTIDGGVHGAATRNVAAGGVINTGIPYSAASRYVPNPPVAVPIGDTLNLLDSAQTVGRTYNVDGSYVSRNAGPLVAYANIELAGLQAGSGDDLLSIEMGGLPSVVTFDGDGGADSVRIRGTGADDAIRVDDIAVDPATRAPFEVAGTEFLHVDGRAGNDVIVNDTGSAALPATSVPSLLEGGLGQDILVGGYQADVIFGGTDIDALLGRLGSDWLFGDVDSLGTIIADGGDLIYGNEGDGNDPGYWDRAVALVPAGAIFIDYVDEVEELYEQGAEKGVWTWLHGVIQTLDLRLIGDRLYLSNVIENLRLAALSLSPSGTTLEPVSTNALTTGPSSLTATADLATNRFAWYLITPARNPVTLALAYNPANGTNVYLDVFTTQGLKVVDGSNNPALVFNFSGTVGQTYYVRIQGDNSSVGLTITNAVVPGAAAIGLYDPAAAAFFLRNSNNAGNADATFGYGPPASGWLPIAGDWNNHDTWTGNGTDTIGLYDPATSTFYLRNSNTPGAADLTFGYGPAGLGWLPLAGDFNGDGIDTIGLYDAVTSTFYLKNTNSGGIADLSFVYGAGGLGWAPIVGDWDGDGVDTIGLYDPAASAFFLRNSNTPGVADVAFAYGPAGSGWQPMAGDWNGDGTTTIGLFDAAASTFYLRNSNSPGLADYAFGYGLAPSSWFPVAGAWNAPGGSPLMAAGGEVAAAADVAGLAGDAVAPLVAQAIADWAALGLSAQDVAALTSIEFVVTDLPGALLGLAERDAIYLDRDAAGHGWFVDPTPAADEEFARDADGRLAALDPQAVDRIDLLTVIAHELGHELGLADLDDSLADLMRGSLETGLRREPGLAEIDAVLAGAL